MDEHIVLRDGDKPLRFEGEVIGFASSYGGKPRWFEVEIYRTSTGKFVVHGAGMSDMEGEDDWHWAMVCSSGEEVVEALYRKNREGLRYLPRTSQDALAEASECESMIGDAYMTEV